MTAMPTQVLRDEHRVILSDVSSEAVEAELGRDAFLGHAEAEVRPLAAALGRAAPTPCSASCP